MNRDFIGALLQLNAEKGVPQDILLQTLEQAIESAYRRNADAPEKVAELDRALAELAGRYCDADGNMEWEYLLVRARRT